MNYSITEQDDGVCIRQFLRLKLHLSNKMTKYLKYRNNGITVNGEPCTVRRILHTGDVLSLAMEDTESSAHLHAVELPLDILYEDRELVIPSKSAEMPTHPSHGHHDDTVANALAYRYRRQGTPFVFRPINRLDRNTSGLLLIARNKQSAGILSVSMQKGQIQKAYLAILDGEMTELQGTVHAPLHRTAESIIVREVCAPDAADADDALTEYRVLCRGNGHTLVLAYPITGRTHQLRVHFAHLSHPITGDELYGTPSPLIGRHALHAYALRFPHPSDGETKTVFAPPPPDFLQLFRSLFPETSLEEQLKQERIFL